MFRFIVPTVFDEFAKSILMASPLWLRLYVQLTSNPGWYYWVIVNSNQRSQFDLQIAIMKSKEFQLIYLRCRCFFSPICKNESWITTFKTIVLHMPLVSINLNCTYSQFQFFSFCQEPWSKFFPFFLFFPKMRRAYLAHPCIGLHISSVATTPVELAAPYEFAFVDALTRVVPSLTV